MVTWRSALAHAWGRTYHKWGHPLVVAFISAALAFPIYWAMQGGQVAWGEAMTIAIALAGGLAGLLAAFLYNLALAPFRISQQRVRELERIAENNGKLVPKPIQFRLLTHASTIDVMPSAALENASDGATSFRVIGWRCEIGGNEPNYDEPVDGTTTLTARELGKLGLPHVRVNKTGASITGVRGFVEMALLYTPAPSGPEHGLHFRFEFKFDEYGAALKRGETQTIDEVLQTRTFEYGTPEGIREIARQRALKAPAKPS